jgi:signal transduction histidine kinase
LHDGLGQQLTGIGYLAESLRSDLQERAPLLVGQARRLVQATQQALDQMRKIAKGMLPVEIDPLGLMSALEQLVESTQQLYGIRGSFCCPHPVAVPDATLATELFRIAQEAVGNIARHSQGQSLEITLAVNENVLCLAIRDDGVGIANRGSKADGLGLRIMRYRAGLIGASLEFQGLETGGTIVTCRLALEDEDDRSSHAAEDDVQGSDRR